MTRFSVILPVRNGMPYVKACVESILRQNYPEFELVVLDNCSTDGTREWLQTQLDRRIRIVTSHTPLSIGESWARVKDVEKQPFMTLIGHDDLLDENFLGAIKTLIEAYPHAGLYQTGARLIDSQGKLIRNCKPVPVHEDAGGYLRARFAFTRDISGTGFVMRSADYDREGGIPPFEKLFFADDALWLTLMRDSFKASDPLELCSIRLHPKSESASLPNQWGSLLHGLNQFMEFLEVHSRQDEVIVSARAEGEASFLTTYHRNIYIFALIEASMAGRRIDAKVRQQIEGSLARWVPGIKDGLQASSKVKAIAMMNASPARSLVPILWSAYRRLTAGS